MNKTKSLKPLLWSGLLGAALLAAAVWAASTPLAAAPDLQSDIARTVARRLPQWHLSQHLLNDEIAGRALERYLSFLDYGRSYFRASDIAAFEQAATNLNRRLANGDLSFAYEAYDVLLARASNRLAFVEQVLQAGLDLNSTNTFVWKRTDAPWAADDADWDSLWRQMIQNQYVAHLVNRELAPATNGTPPAAGDPPDTGPESEDEVPPADLRLTPEEALLKSYRQYLTVLNDNRAEWPVERYLSAFAKAYDPHTEYMSASQTEDFEIGMQLSLVGIGARLTSEDGAAKIDQLIPGGPAEKDGRLKAGDKIIAVAQGDEPPVSILHWPLSKAVRLIRGEKNTKVVLTIIPASDPSGTAEVKVDLIRDEVKLEDQAAKSFVRDFAAAGTTHRLGIIALPDFYADVRATRNGSEEPRSSAMDVRRLLRELATNVVEGIVLDLRNNGGGLLPEAVRMTGLFIDKGPVVQVSDGRRSQVLSDSDPEIVYDGPLLVLVNRQTASASEILAAALQDYGRALVVGDSKTHGKGTVQTLADLRDGQPAFGKLKITTASFYRISGGSTQVKGVESDIAMPSSLDALEIGEETLPYAIPWSRISAVPHPYDETLSARLPALRERAEARRAEDARYQTYVDLIRRLSEQQRNPRISLNLEERLAQARSEKELRDKLLDKDNPDPKDPKSDIVLTETLNILCDLIELSEPPPETPPGEEVHPDLAGIPTASR